MKCLSCGEGQMKASRENHKYDASGLPGVTLMGVEVLRCSACDEEEVVIPALDDLHRAIARHIILRPERLVPQEIRFLRKHLGFTGIDLAAHLGVAPETVSRWENGAHEMEVPAEKLLRLLVARKEPATDYERELPKVATKKAGATHLRLRKSSQGWRPAKAA